MKSHNVYKYNVIAHYMIYYDIHCLRLYVGMVKAEPIKCVLVAARVKYEKISRYTQVLHCFLSPTLDSFSVHPTRFSLSPFAFTWLAYVYVEACALFIKWWITLEELSALKCEHKLYTIYGVFFNDLFTTACIVTIW